jgi:ferredoxin
MNINKEVCTNCVKCLPTCPVDAIYIDKEKKQVSIDQDLCVECGVCYRAEVCLSHGLVQPVLTWPRTVRAALSNPLIINPETRIPGRGTEEMKTNDVTGRFKSGQIGIAAELGRPGVGTSFSDIQKVSRACAKIGVHFCPENPITSLMVNKKTGDINPEVMGERVLSGIVEMTVSFAQALLLLRQLKEVSKELDTVFSLDVISLVEQDGSIPMYEILQEIGIPASINGKNNMGLGKPGYQFFDKE